MNKPPAGPLGRIFEVLRSATGCDLNLYKPSTVMRRIERRMAHVGTPDLEAYETFLREHPEEPQALKDDLLIGVTEFFRDPGAFGVLGREVLQPLILAKAPAGTPLRIWSTACSTGEEAYTLALLCKSLMDQLQVHVPLQIFASDMDSGALLQARRGLFPLAIQEQVPEAIFEKYFIREGSHYKISKALRECIIFAEHNLLADPPYSHIDLISCRNLLIYLKSEAQRRLMEIFAYSLDDLGSLFLGVSESIPSGVQGFEPVDRKWKIFKKIPRDHTGRKPLPPHPQPRENRTMNLPHTTSKKLVTDKELVRNLLLETFTPPGILVNPQGEIMYIHGVMGPYLTRNPGKPSNLLVDNLVEDLKIQVANALDSCLTEQRPKILEALRVKSPSPHYVRIFLNPVEPSPEPGSVLVVFQSLETPRSPENLAPLEQVAPDHRIRELELELFETRRYIQATVAELESTNEELVSSNEEAQSMNEELQSANEELESSKEELQAANEELSTLNDEYQKQIEDLAKANNDIFNFVRSARIGMIFMDRDFKILRFTPEIEDVLPLIDKDIGRSIEAFSNQTRTWEIESLGKKVLLNLTPEERQIQKGDHQWFLMRIMPYRTLEDRIEGLIITFTDITRERNAVEALRESEAQFRNLFMHMTSAFALHEIILDPAGQPVDYRFISANPAFEKLTGLRLSDIIGRTVLEVLPGTEKFWIENYGRVALTGESFSTENFSAEISRYFEVFAYCPKKGQFAALFTDVTDRRITRNALEESEKQFRGIFEFATVGLIISQDARILKVNSAALKIFGYRSTKDLEGRPLTDLVWPGDRDQVRQTNQLRESGETFFNSLEYTGLKTDGQTFPMLVNLMTMPMAGKPATVAFITDLTEKKQIETALVNTQRLEALGLVAGGIAHDFNNLLGGVFGYLDLARQFAEPSSRTRTYLDSALTAFDRARDLTKQLLTFSKGGSPCKTPQEIPPLIAKSVSFALTGSPLTVEYQIPEDLWICEVDEHQFAQVIDNMVINARQVLPQGGKISISARNLIPGSALPIKLSPGPYIKVTLQDSGPGIPSGIINKIFDPFFSTKKEGSGLGLATAYSIISKHGGTIEAESIPGQGASFHIYLPASPHLESHEEPQQFRLAQGAGRILILDDEDFLLEIGKDMVEALGYEVFIAHGGQEAMRILETQLSLEKPVDLMILDLTIPGEKGALELLPSLKKISPHTLAVASSGYAKDPVLLTPGKFGFDGGLPKPYMVQDLSKLLAILLNQEPSA